MRLNKFLAAHTGLSRRAADAAIENGRVEINDSVAKLGSQVKITDAVKLDGKSVTHDFRHSTVLMLNKPVGYISSRRGQGSKTIYSLVPRKYHNLKTVGRLDKDSTGLLLLTDDGELANRLTHPSFEKEKTYIVELDKPLTDSAQVLFSSGINLSDGLSKLEITGKNTRWTVKMKEGRNRQIRRTFAALGYRVVALHRTQFGPYSLDNLETGEWQEVPLLAQR